MVIRVPAQSSVVQVVNAGEEASDVKLFQLEIVNDEKQANILHSFAVE